MNSFKFLDTPLFLRKMTRQRYLWMSLPAPRLVMSSGSISKGVYPPVVQMRSPGCQWQDNDRGFIHGWVISGLSVGAFNPNPLRTTDVTDVLTISRRKSWNFVFFSRSWHCQKAIVSSWAWEHWPETLPFSIWGDEKWSHLKIQCL